MARTRRTFVLVGLCLLSIGARSAPARIDESVVRFTIQIRDNVTVEMGATVITNPANPDRGLTVLTLNGTGQTAKTFAPLAAALLADHPTGNLLVSRMILLDWPGRGNSGLPIGVRFGELGVNDYVTALLESLEALGRGGLGPDALLGHSLGAEIIQMAQTRLVTQGTSLRARFDIRAAIFLVPDIASPLPWSFVSEAGALLAPFVRDDPTLGPIVDLPPPVWVQLHYQNRAGQIAPNAPTPQEAAANGHIALEPATLIAELYGLPPFPQRPAIDPVLFGPASGSAAAVVAFEQDPFYVFPAEHANLYTFITGDQRARRLFAIEGLDRVHNVHVIDPDAVIRPLTRLLMDGRNAR